MNDATYSGPHGWKEVSRLASSGTSNLDPECTGSTTAKQANLKICPRSSLTCRGNSGRIPLIIDSGLIIGRAGRETPFRGTCMWRCIAPTTRRAPPCLCALAPPARHPGGRKRGGCGSKPWKRWKPWCPVRSVLAPSSDAWCQICSCRSLARTPSARALPPERLVDSSFSSLILFMFGQPIDPAVP